MHIESSDVRTRSFALTAAACMCMMKSKQVSVPHNICHLLQVYSATLTRVPRAPTQKSTML